MSLASNNPTNQRQLNDANFVSAVSLATGTSTAFNLVSAAPYPTTEQIVLEIDTGVLAGTNTTAAFAVQDSADGVTFTSVSTLGSITKTVPTTTPATASLASWLLPPSIKQYVRVSSSLSGATTGNFTASLSF